MFDEKFKITLCDANDEHRIVFLAKDSRIFSPHVCVHDCQLKFNLSCISRPKCHFANENFT